ncbi:hypothetical protein [Corynebacterium uterequi]|uniref:Uncharacterized protein n=1 Tax=Corynebacterium uterequi TaxID=1072256 RepID=A0A0G3HEM9_9CORY|nr:hypothetical protein [Corynebacterium uterequi]AKK10428.1 hypothetical protein CUTER_02065 [Corynebacterium uterequi]
MNVDTHLPVFDAFDDAVATFAAVAGDAFPALELPINAVRTAFSTIEGLDPEVLVTAVADATGIGQDDLATDRWRDTATTVLPGVAEGVLSQGLVDALAGYESERAQAHDLHASATDCAEVLTGLNRDCTEAVVETLEAATALVRSLAGVLSAVIGAAAVVAPPLAGLLKAGIEQGSAVIAKTLEVGVGICTDRDVAVAGCLEQLATMLEQHGQAPAAAAASVASAASMPAAAGPAAVEPSVETPPGAVAPPPPTPAPEPAPAPASEPTDTASSATSGAGTAWKAGTW